MNGLRPLDAGFVELEDSDRHISLGIGAVAILSGPPPDRAEFSALFAERVAGNARLRERIHRAPLDLATPVWEEDPGFDLAHHIRWAALPEPADDDALFELIAGEVAGRLDRDHPLWQCVVIERMTGGRWALLLKMHHSVVDGVSGATLLADLCDREGERSESEAPQAESNGVAASGRFGAANWFGWTIKALRLPFDAPRAAVRTVRGLAPVVAGLGTATAGSSLTGAIGQQRRYTVARASLAEMKEIGAAFGATVNDVVLASIAGAYRELLVARGEEPTPDKLRMLVPVSMRTADAARVLDNRVTAMLAFLPVHVSDPVERLAAIHERMNQHKGSGETSAEDQLLALLGMFPFAPLAWSIRLLARLPQTSVTAVATNVPGPRRALTLAGRPVLELLPVLPIAMRLRSGIAILSYADHLTFGITGDYDTMPDLGVIAATIDTEIRQLLTAARGR